VAPPIRAIWRASTPFPPISNAKQDTTWSPTIRHTHTHRIDGRWVRCAVGSKAWTDGQDGSSGGINTRRRSFCIWNQWLG